MNAVKFTPLMGDVTVSIAKYIFNEEEQKETNIDITDINPVKG